MLLFSFMSWVLIGFGRYIESPVQRFVFDGLILLSPAMCLCGGIVIAMLAAEGPGVLGRLPRIIWTGVYAGVVVSLGGVLVHLSWRLFPSGPIRATDSHFGLFSMGLPMVVPAAHALIARFHYRAANRTMEPTR